MGITVNRQDADNLPEIEIFQSQKVMYIWTLCTYVQQDKNIIKLQLQLTLSTVIRICTTHNYCIVETCNIHVHIAVTR